MSFAQDEGDFHVGGYVAKHILSCETRKLIYPAGLMNPEDLLTFIYFDHFTKAWNDSKLTDDDLRALELLIMAAPTRHPVVPGTGRLRKCRFAPARWNAGKSGALRVGYVFFEEFSTVAMILVFSKKDQANVSPAERKVIKQLIQRLHQFLSKDD